MIYLYRIERKAKLNRPHVYFKAFSKIASKILTLEVVNVVHNGKSCLLLLHLERDIFSSNTLHVFTFVCNYAIFSS